MAKNFPFFKFIATEWLTGDIVYEDYELQGIFINVCAIYWHRNGDVTIDEIHKRLKTDRLFSLTDRFISVNESRKISIEFLDEQLVDANHISKVNSENGKLGGRPKSAQTKEKKPTANRPQSETKAKKSKEEKEEELELNKNKRKEEFKKALALFKNDYDLNTLKYFYEYWTESNKYHKMRFELQETFEIPRRLATWIKKEKNFAPKKENAADAKFKQHIDSHNGALEILKNMEIKPDREI